jgi:acrylyl-CoA reductase (NADPH)
VTELPGTFAAFVVRRDGDVSTRGVEDLAADALGDDGVLVSVEWSGVNYKDAMAAAPGNRVARADVLVPGVDLAGVVVGGGDPDLAPGTPVLAHGHDIGVAHHGGFAAFARVRPEWIVPLPAGLSARDAMILGTAGFTAAMSVDALEEHGLSPGQGPVLVTGASGGVGSIAVSILAARGYEVTASSGKAGAQDWLRARGAATVIGRDELDEAPGRVLAPERWSGAVDCVGGATLALVLRSLRYGAAVAASGLTGGGGVDTTVYPFITRAVSLLGIDSVKTPRGRRLAVWARLAGALRPPDLDAFVDREIGLKDLDAALDDILGAKIRGRILVRPAP